MISPHELVPAVFKAKQSKWDRGRGALRCWRGGTDPHLGAAGTVGPFSFPCLILSIHLTSQTWDLKTRYCLNCTWRGCVSLQRILHNVLGCGDQPYLLFSTPNYQMLTNHNEEEACSISFQKWQHPGREGGRLLKNWQTQGLNFSREVLGSVTLPYCWPLVNSYTRDYQLIADTNIHWNQRS